MEKQKEEVKNDHICTVGHLRFMDNFLRKMVHNPKKLFGHYIKEGMTVMDIGCGGGFVTIDFAGMVGEKGKVIAADLQPEMLEVTRNKLEKAGLADRVVFYRCRPDKIGYDGSADFALAFFMVHETPDIPGLLNEVYSILKKGGLLYISEPNLYVSKEEFEYTVNEAARAGFKIHSYPKVMIARSVILEK